MHGTAVSVDSGGGSRGDSSLLDFRTRGSPRRIVEPAGVSLTLAYPAAGLGFALGRPAARFRFPGTVIVHTRAAVGAAGTVAFRTPAAAAGTRTAAAAAAMTAA